MSSLNKQNQLLLIITKFASYNKPKYYLLILELLGWFALRKQASSSKHYTCQQAMNSSQWKKLLQWKGKIHHILNFSLLVAISLFFDTFFVQKFMIFLKNFYSFRFSSKESIKFHFFKQFFTLISIFRKFTTRKSLIFNANSSLQ